jgi:hypothetical protein
MEKVISLQQIPAQCGVKCYEDDDSPIKNVCKILQYSKRNVPYESAKYQIKYKYFITKMYVKGSETICGKKSFQNY